MKIVIPSQPISVNQLYRGRRFLTREGGRMKAEYAIEARRQYRHKPIKGDIEVLITFRFVDRRQHDIDNCLKAVLDSLTGILWEDDSQITDLHVHKEMADAPSVEISAFAI